MRACAAMGMNVAWGRPEAAAPPVGGVDFLLVPDNSMTNWYRVRLITTQFDPGNDDDQTFNVEQAPLAGTDPVRIPYPASAGGDDMYYDLFVVDIQGEWVLDWDDSTPFGSGDDVSLRGGDGQYRPILFTDIQGSPVLDYGDPI